MKNPQLTGRGLSLLLAAAVLCANASAQPTVTYQGAHSDATDYSASGLNLGSGGYWFANFGTVAPETDQPVAQNAVDTLPSWFMLNSNFDPDPNTSMYSWDQENVLGSLVNASSSIGGNPAFATLTLPDGSSGLSGQAVTTWEAGNTGQSRNLLDGVVLGPGVPSIFDLHVVVDNEDAATGTGVRRVKARLKGPGVPDDTEDDTGNGIDDTRNNIPDVYSFRYEGMEEGMVLRLQLRTTSDPIGGDPSTVLGAGMAGFMINVIPEPSAAILLLVSTMAVGSLRVRRRS